MNNVNYKIIDNFLPEKIFKELKDKIISFKIPWYFQSEINYVHTEKDLDCYFTHEIFNHQKPSSSLFTEIYEIIKQKLNINALIRIKINCYPKSHNLEIHKPHIDYDFNHKGAIYYINNNNGYTILENNIKIESIENRILFFDPHKLHSSTNCTNQKARFNINFNYF